MPVELKGRSRLASKRQQQQQQQEQQQQHNDDDSAAGTGTEVLLGDCLAPFTHAPDVVEEGLAWTAKMMTGSWLSCGQMQDKSTTDEMGGEDETVITTTLARR